MAAQKEPGAAAPRARKPAASEATLREARRLFETSALSGSEIARRLGLFPQSLHRMAKTHGWRRPAAAEARRRLVGQLRAKVDTQITAAERALAADADAGPAARTLASLVRTLRELARYDEDRQRAVDPRRGRDDEDAHDVVADPDALREALAERLERLRLEREA